MAPPSSISATIFNVKDGDMKDPKKSILGGAVLIPVKTASGTEMKYVPYVIDKRKLGDLALTHEAEVKNKHLTGDLAAVARLESSCFAFSPREYSSMMACDRKHGK
eukprot:CAMPEP_0169253978 /NCGR_PEP_ID=MMETSP1016-20121227/38917_1 /TAXON_ID=342587 /ORGANISM="Karlodinium micrum, Strain CCMP2283" /LENGTH=105 /DNA_ID=CAMNT_0009335383 /DNA_START=57 /DNA_END=372 /DNA_ORIENTATION=-